MPTKIDTMSHGDPDNDPDMSDEQRHQPAKKYDRERGETLGRQPKNYKWKCSGSVDRVLN